MLLGDPRSPSHATATGPAPTYAEYLNLDQLLSVQFTRSDVADEPLFIALHQICELWFKQLLHECRGLQERLTAADLGQSVRLSRRILAIWSVIVSQFDVLETMPPGQFARLRPHLGTASAFESAQFRELEAVLGRRDAAVAVRYPPDSAARQRIAAAMARPSLYDSLLTMLAALGYLIPERRLHRDVTRPVEPDAELESTFEKVYADDGTAAVLCELFTDLDELVQLWRYRHAKAVERIIGGKRGTAGSSGVGYLRTTLHQPAFPELWTFRSQR
ncbi:tryptophan 2,3-dioxygenase [Micromonospora sp. CPCC 206061]|uniref:tryptophan 2,3-dioxygenase n=1 Tax=Micromonospora sp. CPCC 206061 TaxID=3122410 RepID=UPI002FEF66DC